MVLQVAKYFA